ncbi:MAG: flavin monoamine oxidase family protein [Actinomycetales bacterium]
MSESLKVIAEGLPAREQRHRVVVVGAGLAGLCAAYELDRAGHEVLVLEAQARVGGRIQTLREPFSDGLYAEAGGMRFPASHDLTMAYVRAFGLRTSPFTMGNPNAYVYMHGRRMRQWEFTRNPAALGFTVHAHEEGLQPLELWQRALAPIEERLAADPPGAWGPIMAEHDNDSLREFLERCGWSEGAIEMFGLFSGYSGRMNASFIDIIRPEIGGSFADLVEIDGGSDLLPRAFLPALAPRIRFGARMVAIEQSSDSATVHLRTLSNRESVSADYVIVATPLPTLRHVEVLTPFSRSKQQAIREVHYDASTKVLLQCRRRFWEEDDGIVGGGTVTDLAIRNLYYPDHHRQTGRGVLLASYTWAEDAQRWDSLEPRDRIEQAIEDVARIHPQILQEFEVGASKSWHDDPYAGGAFALFEPGQFTRLYEPMCAPEGRIHFAGEHASVYHRWIQGAIESGLRAASAVHASP